MEHIRPNDSVELAGALVTAAWPPQPQHMRCKQRCAARQRDAVAGWRSAGAGTIAWCISLLQRLPALEPGVARQMGNALAVGHVAAST